MNGGGQLAGPAAGDLPSLASLQAELPAPMRQPRFAPASLPPRYASAIRHGGPGQEIDLSPLPARMRQETAWCLFRIIEIGGTVAVPAVNMLARRLGEAVADHEDGRGPVPASLLDLPVQEWSRRIAHAVHRRTGRLPAATTTRNTGSLLARMTGLLTAALDTEPWWRRDEWDPVKDGRIPLREHEPMGRYTVRSGQITTGWLRAGAQWHCKTGLETGTLTWSTVHRRVSGIREFDAFLSGRRVSGPALADGPAAVRALMLEFLTRLRTRPSARGRRAGKPLTASAAASLAGEIEQFYAHMAGSKDDAAAALGEPGWLALGPEHHGFYRRGELPVPDRPPLEGQVISAAAMTRIMAGAGLLGAPSADEGYGDEQAMRITLLAALLGRRINEICMLDPDPLLPLLPLPGEPRQEEDGDGQAPVAKLRYQQTKIDGAPDTALVHDEVVAIIREQQQWAAARAAARCAPGCRPKYLFLAAQMNRNGDRPYSGKTLRGLLTRLAARLGIREAPAR